MSDEDRTTSDSIRRHRALRRCLADLSSMEEAEQASYLLELQRVRPELFRRLSEHYLDQGSADPLPTQVRDCIDRANASLAGQILSATSEDDVCPELGPRYETSEKLGQGGMGVVWAAHDRVLHREVAVKVIRRGASLLEHSRTQFEWECKTQAKLEHPNIVPIYDSGRTPDGRYFVVMRRIRGRSLAAVIAQAHANAEFGGDELVRLLRVFVDVCTAVAFAHANGVLHRDVKPHNIMVGARGEALVVDWGISKWVGDVGAGEGRPNTLPGGTHGYSAPEQLDGEASDEKADIYSLGATLWTILTGSVPHGQEETWTEPSATDTHRVKVATEVPRDLLRLAQRAMSLRPEARPNAASVVGDAVQSWMVGMVEAETFRRERMKRARLGVAGLAVIAVVMVVASVWLIREQQRVVDQSYLTATVGGVEVLPESARTLLASVRGWRTQPGWEAAAMRASMLPAPARVFVGDWGQVTSASFRPDGSRIVITSTDGWARIWSADGHGAPVALGPHDNVVHHAVFSPDGTRVAAASGEGTLWLWRADGAGLLAKFEGHERGVRHLEFSPDGSRIISGSGDGTARIWRLDEVTSPLVLRHRRGPVDSVAFSPDSQLALTTAADGTARMWDAATGEERRVIEDLIHGRRDDSRVYKGRFSPDGTHVAVSLRYGNAQAVQTRAGGDTLIFGGHRSAVFDVDLSPDGSRIATAGYDSTIRIRSLSSDAWPPRLPDFQPNGIHVGDSIWLNGHTGPVRSVAFSPDGEHVLSGSDDRTARIRRADGLGEPLILRGHQRPLIGATFSPNGRLALTWSADSVRIWNVPTRPNPTVLRHHAEIAWSAEFSPKGSHLATSSDDGTVAIWSTGSADEPTVLPHDASVHTTRFSPDGTRLVTASEDGTVRTWSRDGRPVRKLTGHRDGAVSATFSPDGSEILSWGRDGTARVWSITGGAPRVIEGRDGPIRSARYGPEGKRIVIATGGSALIWSPSGSPVWLCGHESTVWTAEFSPLGDRVVTASSDGTARVWRARDGVPLSVLRGHSSVVWSARFSSDGRYVATASEDHTARVWPADGTGEHVVLRGHEAPVRVAEFGPKGSRVLTADSARSVRVWRADGRTEPLVLSMGNARVSSASFHPNGTQVAATFYDGTVRVWNVDAPAMRSALRGQTEPCLPPSARVRLLGERGDVAEARWRGCELACWGRPPSNGESLDHVACPAHGDRIQPSAIPWWIAGAFGSGLSR